jgi:hypothetical protein
MQASGEKEERDMILNSFYSNSYADLIQSRSCLSEKDALVVYNSLQNATTADKIKSCGKRQRIFNLLFKLYRIMPFSETIPLKWARLVKNIIYPYPLN